jgi:hypothetical protein
VKKTLSLYLVFAGLLAAPAAAQEQLRLTDPAKEADIRRLIDLTGTAKLALQITAASLKRDRALLERAFPPGPRQQEMVDLFVKKFEARLDPRGLTDRMVPIYDKHFSHDDIKALLSFYQSPAGQRTLQAMPMVLQQSANVGVNWGQEIGQQILMEMEKEGVEIQRTP